MDPVCVEALRGRSGEHLEARELGLRDRDVRRRKRLLLVQAPDVQLVHGEDSIELFHGQREQVVWYGSRKATHFLDIVLDVLRVHARRGAFQENESALLDYQTGSAKSLFVSRDSKVLIKPRGMDEKNIIIAMATLTAGSA